MSSATVRPKGGRKDGGYQSFQNSNQSRTSRKWNNNVQHPVNNAPRNQIPQNNQSSTNHHSNNNNTLSSGANSLKPIELVHDEVSANHVNHMHDRMLFLLSNFVGINVVVTVKNGVKYQGLFHAAHTEGELGVILKLARKVVTKPEEKNLPNRVIPVFILPHKEVMEINACGVDFSASLDKCGEREGFRTDADISGRTEIRERELHKWASEESGETMKGLEDDINPESTDASWDQFAANEKLFGIKTDFNEELYTTKLDRSRADFKERERQAIAIANEITRTSTTNIHVLEERGYLVEESQMDEEERYGAVVRNRDPSKYMPPALRKLQEQQQLQQHVTAPTVKKPETVKEPIKDVKTKPTEEPQNIKPVPPSTVPVPPSPSLPKTSPFPPSPLATFRVEPDATSINSNTSKKPDTDADGRPIEALIVKTFRKFANHEKERLQQRKQAIFKKEMDGKMAELLKWGQNFKLSSPLPQDLIPILTKDEAKRQQLAAKSAAAMSEKENDKEKEKLKEKEKEKEKQESEKGKEKDDEKPKEKTNSTPNTDSKTEFLKPIIKIEEDKPQSNGESKSIPEKVTSDKSTSAADKAPPQLPPSKTLATTPTNTQFKLNAKASEWKPNPNAASFTPTPNNAGDKRSPGSSPFFGNRQLKKNSASLKDGFSPFKKGKSLENPNSITPTWPFGQKPFRHHFTVPSNYEEDMYTQASVSQGFGFATYPVAPYRFTAGTQFVVPPMPMQQTTPMQYMPGFAPGMPFTTAPMPPNGAPPTIYSPPIPPVIPQHFGSQGFPSPGRTQIVPTGIHPQMYPPYQSPHGIPPMIHYPREMVHHVPPGGVMMGQRPMMIEQHYETAPMEVMPVSDQTTAQ